MLNLTALLIGAIILIVIIIVFVITVRHSKKHHVTYKTPVDDDLLQCLAQHPMSASEFDAKCSRLEERMDIDDTELNDISAPCNIEAAQRVILPKAQYPRILDNYIFEDTSTIGIFETWHSDPIELAKLSDILSQAIAYCIHNPDDYRTRDHVINILNNFIPRYREALDKCRLDTVPWGGAEHWSAFTINSTRMLAYYLLLDLPVPEQKVNATHIIHLLIKSPVSALGIKVKKHEMVYLAGPYLVAHHFSGSKLKKIRKEDGMQQVYKYLDFKMQDKPGGSGIHRDGANISNDTKSVDFSEIELLATPYAIYFYAFDNRINSNLAYHANRIRDVIYHPSIDQSVQYSENTLIKTNINIKSQMGFKVMPSIKLLRYFTPNHSFIVCANSSYLKSHYCATKHDNYLLNYPTQYRGVFTNSHPKTYNFTYPQPGFFSKSTVGKIVEIDPENVKHSYHTTSCKESYVMTYKNYAYMYQHYSVIEQGLAYSCIERIVIDSNTQTIIIDLLVKNNDQKEDLFYYARKGDMKIDLNAYDKYEDMYHPIIIKKDDKAQITMKYHLADDLTASYSVDQIVMRKAPTIDYKFDESVEVRKSSNKNKIVGVFDGNEIKILSFSEPSSEKEILKTKFNDENITVKFDKNDNQYHVVA